MAPVVKFVELPGRVKLSYVEQGDPSGVPVVLLHGVSDSWYSFEPVLPHLPASIHAFALTQRGHGDSDRPVTGYRTRDFSADVEAFVNAHGLGPVVVVGHSMGSTHAMRFAIDHPRRTLALVLVAAFASYRGNPVVGDFWQSTVSTLADPIDPGLVREFQKSTLAHPVSPEFLDTVVQESLKMPARVWRAAFEGFLEDDFADELGKIQAPTLILWGTRDEFASRHDQGALLKAIAGSQLVVYENTGHALHWEQPERFVADLTAFITSLTAHG
jgi:pimeloyl-ACP methyl ester carboxylesterase